MIQHCAGLCAASPQASALWAGLSSPLERGRDGALQKLITVVFKASVMVSITSMAS